MMRTSCCSLASADAGSLPKFWKTPHEVLQHDFFVPGATRQALSGRVSFLNDFVEKHQDSSKNAYMESHVKVFSGRVLDGEATLMPAHRRKSAKLEETENLKDEPARLLQVVHMQCRTGMDQLAMVMSLRGLGELRRRRYSPKHLQRPSYRSRLSRTQRIFASAAATQSAAPASKGSRATKKPCE